MSNREARPSQKSQDRAAPGAIGNVQLARYVESEYDPLAELVGLVQSAFIYVTGVA
jgi:hypothetical protein